MGFVLTFNHKFDKFRVLLEVEEVFQHFVDFLAGGVEVHRRRFIVEAIIHFITVRLFVILFQNRTILGYGL